MAHKGYSKGDVVWIEIPFTDLLDTKIRPGIIISNLPGDDYIVCKITKEFNQNSPGLVELNDLDFISGKLRVKSYICVDVIFTLEKLLVDNYIGRLSNEKIAETMTNLHHVLQHY